jgi:UDP-glucose 4-epimerase
MKTILVTGAAGYIGSVTVRRLQEEGYTVIAVDSLVQGHRKAIPSGITLYQVDIGDREKMEAIFSNHQIDAVVHFAGFIAAGESVQDPEKYYDNNVRKGLVLLNCMKKFNVKKIVFSSSCAVHGNPKNIPLREEETYNPINPYGETKSMFESFLRAYDKAYGIKHIILRYFNASGAAYDIGEDHDPETHLIPLVLQVALGKRDHIKIFGTNYNTVDGTCVRDYIHVLDLADAHIAALSYVDHGTSDVFNVGTGRGYSVKQIISFCREITGHEIPAVNAERREGDPGVLVASVEKIRQKLGWEAKRGIRDILGSAWTWHSKNPDGFRLQRL